MINELWLTQSQKSLQSNTPKPVLFGNLNADYVVRNTY